MSSWDRARYIPWSRIPLCPAEELSHEKERLFRQLQREADKQGETATIVKDNSNDTQQQQQQQQKSSMLQSQHVFRWSDLFKSAAFGGCIGTITGTVFGFMDGMRTAQQSEVVKNASNMAKGRYLMQGTTRSATLFGTFFGGFHILRYGIRVTADPGEWGEIGLAGVVSLGALMSQPAFRPSMPYASMLVIMDGVHIIMRQWDD